MSTRVRNKGSAALEFALVLPVLLYLLFAVLEYGWFLMNEVVLTNAVAEGARAGVKARDWEEEDPEEFARAAVIEAFWPFQLEDADIDVEELPADYEQGLHRRFQVEVSALEHRELTGYLPDAWVPSLLTAKSVTVFP